MSRCPADDSCDACYEGRTPCLRGQPGQPGASKAPECAGPFVDARDCPVHAADVLGTPKPDARALALEAMRRIQQKCSAWRQTDWADDLREAIRALESKP